MRLAQRPCQDETKLERSLYYHPPRLEMALWLSEFSFNIGQDQTVGRIRVLTGVEGMCVILVLASTGSPPCWPPVLRVSGRNGKDSTNKQAAALGQCSAQKRTPASTFVGHRSPSRAGVIALAHHGNGP